MKPMLAALAFAAALVTSTAHARVVDAKPNGFTIENVVTVPVSPREAWKALVKDVDEWWPKKHSWWGGKFEIDPIAGGCFCELAGDREAMHLIVSFVDPHQTLRMLGGLGPLQGLGLSGALEWRFKAVEGGTQITLAYVAGGYTTADLVKFAPIVDKVQGIQLGSLEAFITKREPPKE
jgi:hypothetical protein